MVKVNKTSTEANQQLNLTKKQLLKALVISAVAAFVILVTIILPAEYRIDPTGVGKLTGLINLKQPGDISSAEEIKNLETKFLTHTTEITVNPNEGLEYKLKMKEKDVLLFNWKANTRVNFEFHGDPGQGLTAFRTYNKSIESEATGLFTAPFDGRHGWYWANDSTEPITITLTTSGYYEVVGIINRNRLR